MKRFASMVLAGFFTVFFLLSYSHAVAGDKSPPPLPLHGTEGYGGVCATYSAYLVNPSEGDGLFGLPGIGVGSVFFSSGKLYSFGTLTETIGGRVELGYGFNSLELDDLPDDIRNATGVDIDEDTVYMHNFNVRVALLKEGDFNLPWLPAVTFGFHYKVNDNIDDIDDKLGGALTSIGIEDTEGIDLTLYASKMITCLPKPVLINLALRSTEAAHTGLLGFTGERELVVEGNVVVFLTGQLCVAGEYRQKPNEYKTIPGLIGREDDWWDFCAAYVFNDHLTISGGYFNLGEVLNHSETEGSYGIKIKWEF